LFLKHKRRNQIIQANLGRMEKFTKLRWVVRRLEKLLKWWKRSLFYTQIYLIVFESVFHITI
jgi:hypothetical protein